MCVVRALIPIQGVLPTRVLTRGETVTTPPSKETSQLGCVETRAAENHVNVVVENFSHEPLIPKSMVIGIAEPVSETMLNLVNSREQTVAKLPTVPRRKNGKETLYGKLLQGKLDHQSQEERRHIEPVLVKYAHVFHDEETSDFKATDAVQHEIIVENDTKIRRQQIRTSFALRG